VKIAATPWWEAVRLRTEISSASGGLDDVQMSLFNAVYGAAGDKPAYAKTGYYGEITFPSDNLVDLMAKVAVRLGAEGELYIRAPALYRLDQGMGGGKSHGLVGLWHLASHPQELAETDIGRAALDDALRMADGEVPADLGDPQVVVLACDNMTAGQGDVAFDGPAKSLHERFLWRLFGGDNALFKRYQPHYADKNKLAEALTAVGRPVLILVDEILDYVRQLSDSANHDLAVKDMAFLKAVFDVVNDVPHVAMVVVMIDSEKDPMALDAAAQANRAEIESNLRRNGTPATVTSNTDFAAILRRRLFENQAPAEVIFATTAMFEAATGDAWRQKVFAALPRTSQDDFAVEVARCYPFHPSLMALAEQEWAPIAGFQKVRSTIKIFAATAYAHAQCGKSGQWAPALIGPGDLPLWSTEVRESIIGSGLIADGRTQANYRGIASADIVGDNQSTGAARLLDLARDAGATVQFVTVNPRAAERMATALFLYSVVGTRAQGRRGATEAELKAAAFVPDAGFSVAEADGVLAELSNPDTGLAALERTPGTGGQPARLFLSTKQTLIMWFRSMRQSASDPDRDAELRRAAESLTSTGPFKDKKFVPEDLDTDEAKRPSPMEAISTAGVDDARTTRLVVLDPRMFSLGNGADNETSLAVTAALGAGNQSLPVSWASSAAFCVVNAQARKVARQVAADYVAWSRVADLDAVKTDDELKAKALDELAEAKKSLHKAVRRAYQHVVYLGQGEEGQGRAVHEFRFEAENQTALDGTTVWAKLIEEGKAVGVGAFRSRALIVNLRDDDYGRPLDELRDLFWSSPRMPLLPGGEQDLKDAIFEAVSKGELRVVDDRGEERAVTRAGEIAVGSSSLRLARPQAVSGEGAQEGANPVPTPVGIGATPTVTRPITQGDGPSARAEVQLALTLTTSLTDQSQRNQVWDVLRRITDRVDDGDASHLQLVVKLVLHEDEANGIAEAARQAGVNPTITPLD
jgi:Protein of unknown function (DUF499)